MTFDPLGRVKGHNALQKCNTKGKSYISKCDTVHRGCAYIHCLVACASDGSTGDEFCEPV